MYFVISTSLNDNLKYNSFYWSGKYLSDILDHLEFDYYLLSKIKNAILYFNKTDQKYQDALLLDITAVETKPNYLKVYFQISKSLNFQSFHIKSALKKYTNCNSISELPFVYVVDETKFFDLLNDDKIITTIKILEEKNNWQEIYKILQTFVPIEKSKIWTDAELLNTFAFATAKLSECTENLKKKLPDMLQRNKVINEKRELRELTIKLRKRAIELEPNNSSFYSNLAYTYYQSVNELKAVGSRRDGNIFNDAAQAIEFIDKALSLSPNRLKDIYRKALLFADVYGTQKLFNNFTPESVNEKLIEYSKALQKSIDGFKEIEKIYNTITDQKIKASNRKIYIKTLYHIAQKSLTLSRIKNNQDTQYNTTKDIQEDALKLLRIADNYINKCIVEDYNKKKQETEIEEMVNIDNYTLGIYKSYLKGLIQLLIYSINKEKDYELKAKKFLQIALETNFPKEMKNQNKIFILQKMATLNIAKENFKAAINTLEPIYKKYQMLPDYAAYTLALAYCLNHQFDYSEEIIKNFLPKSNKIFKYKFEKLNKKIYNIKTSGKDLKNEKEVFNEDYIDEIN